MSDQRKTMTTWRREDGEPIWDEYSFLTDDAALQDDDVASRYVREVWVLESSRVEVHGQRGLCETCHGDQEDEAGEPCAGCAGSGKGRETPYVVPAGEDR